MKAVLVDQVTAYLTSHRTSSLGNIASFCDCSIEELTPIVRMFESQQRLRLAASRCQSGCSRCAGCDPDDGPAALSDRTIIISLEPREELP